MHIAIPETGSHLIARKRRVGKATGSREGAPDDRLRVPTIKKRARSWMVGTSLALLCPPYALCPTHPAMTEQSTRPYLSLDHIRGLFPDHDGRRIGVAADQRRHDGGVDHPQSCDTVHFQLWIDHGHRIVDAHLG
jgi:hypothetical protein